MQSVIEDGVAIHRCLPRKDFLAQDVSKHLHHL